ncbi:porin [Arsukibacterium sp.]|uniref:porin n=1 Tax=Arsukibacterium sp. TaxID=1977258 RepID=UPI002FD8901C
MKIHLLTFAALSALCVANANANTTINGFASIKAGLTTSGDSSLYDYTDKLNFKNESLLALQIRSDLGERLSVTAQLMGRGSNDFDATFEWAFVTYMLTESTRINVGRLRTPFYRYSDFMDVGYAYDWNRVPQGFYGLGFDNIEGISIYHTGSFFEADSTWQLIYGSYSDDITLAGNPASARATDIAGGSWELELGSLSFRMAYLRGDLEISSPMLDPLLTGLTQAGLTDLVAALDFNQDPGQFIGLGMTFDNGSWVLISEYNRIDVKKSFFAQRQNIYLSVGYRFDDFVPYFLIENEDFTSKDAIYAPYQTILPAEFLLPVIGLVQSQRVDANSYSIGMRYNFHSSAAFKVQYTTRDDRLQNDKASLLSFGIDLIF